MTKAQRRRSRRKRSRLNYLATLSRRNPDGFAREWRHILDGWSREVWRRALALLDEDGRPTALAFDVIEEVRNLLRDCGPETYEREWPTTCEVLTRTYCVAVSRATGRALSPRTFAELFRDRICTR